MLTVLSSEEFFYIPYIEKYGLPLFGLSAVLVPIYLYFEISNLGVASSYYDNYHFHEEGLYHMNNLIGPWKDIRRIDFSLMPYVKAVSPSKGVRRITGGRNTAVTVKFRVATLEIHLKGGNAFGPDFTITTSPKFLSFKISSSMLIKAAKRGNPGMEIVRYHEAKGEDFPWGV